MHCNLNLKDAFSGYKISSVQKTPDDSEAVAGSKSGYELYKRTL